MHGVVCKSRRDLIYFGVKTLHWLWIRQLCVVVLYNADTMSAEGSPNTTARNKAFKSEVISLCVCVCQSTIFVPGCSAPESREIGHDRNANAGCTMLHSLWVNCGHELLRTTRKHSNLGNGSIEEAIFKSCLHPHRRAARNTLGQGVDNLPPCALNS